MKKHATPLSRSWLLALCLTALPAAAQDVGHPDLSYKGVVGSPTGTKPESKLWFADGKWWGALWDATARSYEIQRLNTGTQTWVDTDTAIDSRPKSRVDCLWDGARLYVASHKVTTGNGVPANPLLLYRYTYQPTTQRYTLDQGFPAQIGDTSTGSLTIVKDSTGTLWAAWMRDLRVWISRTNGDDRTWSTPIMLPACTTDTTIEDICGIVAFGGNKVGVLWSDIAADAFWFAHHADGGATATWTARTAALSGLQLANDHLNLKSTADGRVFASVRTGLDRVRLLERTAAGTWFSHLVTTTDEAWTRPIVLTDEIARRIHIFATYPAPTGAIHTKFTSLDTIGFPVGIGTPVLRSVLDPTLNDPTSTKQSISRESGLVVLASQWGEGRYWHHYDALGGPVSAVPVARFNAEPRTGYAPLTVQFIDGSTGVPTSWSWQFGDGSAPSTTRHPKKVYNNPGTYNVMLTARNSLGTNSRTEQQWITVLAPPPTLTLKPAGDAQTRQHSPRSNYGGTTQLRVRQDVSSNYHSFLRFYLPDTNKQIASAKLRLFVDDGGPDGGTVHKVDSTWIEDGLTWRNEPPLAQPLGSLGALTNGTWVELDVTAAGLGSGMAAFGIANASTNSIYFSSREGANSPELVLTYAANTVPVAAFEASPLRGSRPLTVQFFDRSRGTPTTWSWDFGDNTPAATVRNPSHVYDDTGDYTVTLTVTSALGSDSETKVEYIKVVKQVMEGGKL